MKNLYAGSEKVIVLNLSTRMSLYITEIVSFISISIFNQEMHRNQTRKKNLSHCFQRSAMSTIFANQLA